MIRLKFHQLYLLSSLLLGVSCSKKFHDVEFERFQLPAASYQELSSLLVVFDQKLPARFRNEFQQQFNSCRPFTQIQYLQEPIDLRRLPRKGVQDYIKQTLSQGAQGQFKSSHGILLIDLSHQRIDNNLERSTAYRHADESSYQWYPNFATPSVKSRGYADGYQLAPTRKTARQNILIRNHIFEYRINFLLYNRVVNQVVSQNHILQRSLLSNFSRSPAIEQGEVENRILDGMVSMLRQQFCSNASVAEQLYYSPDKSTVGRLVNEGIELAKQGRWPLAATKWNSALAQDANNFFANHNLGVHFERAGSPELAAVHYQRIRGQSIPENVERPRHEDFQSQYQRISTSEQILPQIAFITPGNWVYVSAFDSTLRPKRNYSIYRLETIQDRQLNSIGSHLREVGTIQMLEESDLFWLGRIQQATVDYPVRPGDFILP